MKAVIQEVPEYLRQQRKTTGADRWDEMWEGVLTWRRPQTNGTRGSRSSLRN